MPKPSYKNELDLHESKPVGGTRFLMNGFALTRFDTEAKGNSEIAYYEDCSSSCLIFKCGLSIQLIV